jgi:hypothetical protein
LYRALKAVVLLSTLAKSLFSPLSKKTKGWLSEGKLGDEISKMG